MNRSITLTIIALFTLAISVPLKAQNMHFSQFFNSPATINPAATGSMNEDLRFTSFYKDQWRSIGSPYKTMLSSFDAKIIHSKKRNGSLGVGMQVYSDKAGESNMGVSLASLALSYQVKLNRYHTLAGGIHGGVGQRSIQINKLRWDNQFTGDHYDPSVPGEHIPMPNFMMVDFAGGLYWNHVRGQDFNAHGGIAVFHMNNPSQSHYQRYQELLATKYVVHGGAEFALESTNTSILPSFLFMKQGPAREITAGAMARYSLGVDSKYTGLNTSSAFYLGTFYRMGDAIIIATKYDVKNNWIIGFSYDINVSKLKVASSGRGGMEISLVWKGITSQSSRYKMR
ncbi:MAG: PorP/SprF family type IX secretion system membrane protein [Bacteroidetes bacterium]|nr:PorP/SprF family type IX secretion system membrane protein [Bacteroidota bacterium]